MGQGEGYRFSFETMEEILTSLVYTSIPDIGNVYCPLGKGGNQAQDYEFVIAGLYKKVYVNNLLVKDAEFLLLVVKKINGNHHIGRRTLKYNPRITYQGREINQDCYNKMATTLGLSSKSAWFIDEINVNNQDEIHFTAYTLNPNGNCLYANSEERKKAYVKCLKTHKILEGSKGVNLPKHKAGSCPLPLQQIIYGAPGTGKSYSVEEDIKLYGIKDIRTTFHPDSDYSTFVGAYKPQMEKVVVRDDRGFPVKENGKEVYEKRIIYTYTKQAFLKAYIAAWKDLKHPYVLVIEEINRGNCAQIFGDLFQLLDRNDKGFSSYPISTDSDIRQTLSDELEVAIVEDKENIDALYEDPIVDQVLEGSILILPNNLYIWATMNTSDQSLFPIDSAFKRRWEWKYVPISDAGKRWTLLVNGIKYDWWSFLDNINRKIWDATHSEDKKLGYFFCKANAEDGIITADKFVGKVLFYIYNDVFKDYGFDDAIFHDENDEENPELLFKDFFLPNGKPREDKIQVFLKNLGVKTESEATATAPAPYDESTEDGDESSAGTMDSEGPSYGSKKPSEIETTYSFDGKSGLNYGGLAVEIIKKFIAEHPEFTYKQFQEQFPDDMIGEEYKLSGLLASKKVLDSASYDVQKKNYERFKTGRKFKSSDNIEFCINGNWNSANISSIIEFAEGQGWAISKEE